MIGEPETMHPKVRQAFNAIDAGLFSGDCFHSVEARAYLAHMCWRWLSNLPDNEMLKKEG